MQYVRLGKTEIRISRIGMGGMSLEDNPASEAIVHEAIEAGINYFDTADIYGHGSNEVMLGKAIKWKRNQLIIASKVGNRPRSDGKGLNWDPSKQHILLSIEETLKRLGTDYLDLYQLHGGMISDRSEEAIEAFELLKKQGKILQYGISSIRPNVIRRWVKESKIVSVMMQYSLLDRRPEEECLDLLSKSGIGVLVRGAVAQGLLVNKKEREYIGRSAEEVRAAKEMIHRFSGDSRSPAQTAIQFALYHPAVSSTIIGIRTVDQLREAIAVFDVPWLSEEEFGELRKVIGENYYEEHRE